MPGEVGEGGSKVWCRGQVEAETGEVNTGVGEEEEDGAQLGDFIEATNEKDELNKAESDNDRADGVVVDGSPVDEGEKRSKDGVLRNSLENSAGSNQV